MIKSSIRNIARLLTLTFCATAVAAPMIACGGDKGKKYDNERTALVLATDTLDEVFNPFFYTSGSDGEIVSQTQIGMLTSDENGKPTAGWDEACVVHDYSIIQHGTIKDQNGNDYSKYYTDYYFAIKDNIVFSDGVPLTKKDVLFNIYMYLDPAYAGSSTMYSVKIQGLDAYRTNDPNATSSSDNDSYYSSEASARINCIREWADERNNATWAELSNYEHYDDEATIEKDILKAHELFKEELEGDWNSAVSVDPTKDYAKYVDSDGKLILDTAWKIFLYRYGIFSLIPHRNTADTTKIDYYELNDKNYNYTESKYDKETVIQYVYDYFLYDHTRASQSYKDNLVSIITYYATAQSLFSYVRSDCIRHDLSSSERKVKSVSGIEFIKANSIPTKAIDGGDFISTSSEVKDAVAASEPRKLTDASGNEKAFDVLHIRINGVDPKAIQNFSFTVAPGHYYSSVWDQFDEQEGKFGVVVGDPDFMTSVKTNQLPRGAGPYVAATSRDKVANTKSEFCTDNNVYFIRNDSFLLGKPVIKKLRYKVVANNMLYNSVVTGDVHYASPSMDYETVQKLEKTDSNKLDYDSARNLGYGYIGVSATYIPNIYIRRAIMMTLNPDMCVQYYGGTQYAETILRPMSKTMDDYYPKDAEPYYDYCKPTVDGKIVDKSDEIVNMLLNEGGCTLNRATGVLSYDGKPLKYTFTVAGDSDDHPANAMLINSSEILNAIGFDITVVHDSSALIKLASGQLTVWAAAWSSSSDPDMFQVYHKNSNATSIQAWGYAYLTSSQADPYQRKIVNDLSELIEEGRDYITVEERKPVYEKALDKLMELAVEFPTYQRKNYFVWQKGLFDNSTLYRGTRVSAYRSPLSDIWKVSFNKG